MWIFYPVIFHDAENNPGRILIRDRFGQIMVDIPTSDGFFTPILENKNLRETQFIQDLISVEDSRFFEHYGIDVRAKIRAIRDNLQWQTTSGWSTITEQWIKNTYFKKESRTYLQKTREAFLALLFSFVYSKDEILIKYIDQVYLGHQIYGIQSGMETFFGKKSLATLTPAEIITLTALIHNPTADTSEEDFSVYREKIRERLWYEPISEYPPVKKKKIINNAPFIVPYAQKLCQQWWTTDLIFFRKYDCNLGEFESTIDYSLSIFAREQLKNQIALLDGKNVTNGALIALHPFTWEVLLYEGSKNFNDALIDGQVDVLQSQNQMWSTMKPFLYYMALTLWFHTDDLLIDTNKTYPSFQPGLTYISENYTLKEYGLVRFKEALWNSLNNASVRLAEILWLNEVYDFYKTMWFPLSAPAEYYGYALILGNPDITLIDLVRWYRHLVPKPSEKEYSEKFLLYEILRDPDNRSISFGTNSILNTSIYQAVKTWTSSNFRDNTLVSYSPSMVVGVWVGNNDNSPMRGITGISWAGRLWHQVVEEIIRKKYIIEDNLPIPPGLEKTTYCLDTNCYRKEMSYQRLWKKYFSRIRSNIYDVRDIRGFTVEDDNYLRGIGFPIRH